MTAATRSRSPSLTALAVVLALPAVAREAAFPLEPGEAVMTTWGDYFDKRLAELSALVMAMNRDKEFELAAQTQSVLVATAALHEELEKFSFDEWEVGSWAGHPAPIPGWADRLEDGT